MTKHNKLCNIILSVLKTLHKLLYSENTERNTFKNSDSENAH